MLRLAIFSSQSGTTFEHIAKKARTEKWPLEVVCLVTNRPHAGCVERAQSLGVPSVCVEPRSFSSDLEWDQALVQALAPYQVDYILLAGFMWKIGPHLLTHYPQRVLNTHPSLLPKYGGKGMYGSRVHQAVLEAGESQTGVSLHQVTEFYDDGQIVAQVEVPVLPGDTLESLQARVKEKEKVFLTEQLIRLAKG